MESLELELKELELDLELAEDEERRLWVEYLMCGVKSKLYENHSEHSLRSYYQESNIIYAKWLIVVDKSNLNNAKSEKEKMTIREKIKISQKKLELYEKQYSEWKVYKLAYKLAIK